LDSFKLEANDPLELVPRDCVLEVGGDGVELALVCAFSEGTAFGSSRFPQLERATGSTSAVVHRDRFR